ncbi:MAG: DUF4845 domain-containing protein [Candidatus Thiodiazotropha sp. L084R]
MQSIKKQNGLTFISWLIILIVAGFLVMVGLKLAPVYIDHYAVKTALESVANEPFAARKSKGEIRNLILKRLDINSIRHVSKEHITIKRSSEGTNVNIKYEVRRHIAYNAAVVMTFDESVGLTSN